MEDDKDMQAFIRKQFLNNYLVYTANDGNEGIGILENHPIDIIVTDMMMPNMDGIAFCRTVKQNFLWSHIPVIMLTAKTNVGSKIEAFETGADAYLDKPSIFPTCPHVSEPAESRRLLFQNSPRHRMLPSIAETKQRRFSGKLNEIIEKNIENPDFSIDDLAKEPGISNSGLLQR